MVPTIKDLVKDAGIVRIVGSSDVLTPAMRSNLYDYLLSRYDLKVSDKEAAKALADSVRIVAHNEAKPRHERADLSSVARISASVYTDANFSKTAHREAVMAGIAYDPAEVLHELNNRVVKAVQRATSEVAAMVEADESARKAVKQIFEESKMVSKNSDWLTRVSAVIREEICERAIKEAGKSETASLTKVKGLIDRKRVKKEDDDL